ncbi:MAG: transporter substrate-binding domain-containing protein, partial [Firmicutes bacterium]|nr:transporter substrate-binding domain-containing protein [Bacillota bacterium]
MVQIADQNKKRYTILIVLVLIVLTAIFVIERLGSANSASAQLDQIGASQTAENKVMVDLTSEEQAYLDALGPVKICVDPDWIPYEEIDASGKYSGIAADLIDLIAERSGVTLELVPTDNWEASLDESQVGGCVVLSFLNDTPVREGWLVFTNTYFTDPSVLISREDHPFIANLSDLYGETMALPKGTSTEERIRREYPNIGIILVDSEVDAIKMVENRQADMTLRSMTMAAYTIKQEGFFNLKIVEDLPDYTNNFRLGVVNSQPMLRDILNKGIATLTPQEVQKIVNQYVSITVESY